MPKPQKYFIEFEKSHNYKDIFPSLNHLKLSYMPNQERWSSQQQDRDGDNRGRRIAGQVIFRHLCSLLIYECPNLAIL